jgi:glycosyltransferase involved in cell wall biosynthesis
LRSLCSQTISPSDFEIVVVDNSVDDDETEKKVEAAVLHYPRHRITLYKEKIPGLLSARHRGTLEAKSHLLVFIDDDVTPHSKWLEAILQAFEDKSVQIIAGRNLPDYEVKPPEWLDSFWTATPYGGKMCVALSLLDIGTTPRFVDARYAWGLNFAIKKDTLIALGGFHPDSVPTHLQRFQGDGETGLGAKASSRRVHALYEPAAAVEHRIPSHRLTKRYFEQRAFYEGVALSYSTIRECGGVSDKTWQTRFVLAEAFSGLSAEEFTQKSRRALGLDTQVLRIKKMVQCAFIRGFEFHHGEVERDDRLLSWVLRENYWRWDYIRLDD